MHWNMLYWNRYVKLIKDQLRIFGVSIWTYGYSNNQLKLMSYLWIADLISMLVIVLRMVACFCHHLSDLYVHLSLKSTYQIIISTCLTNFITNSSLISFLFYSVLLPITLTLTLTVDIMIWEVYIVTCT